VKVEELIRYDHYVVRPLRPDNSGMWPTSDGSFVRFEDVRELMESHDPEVTGLVAKRYAKVLDETCIILNAGRETVAALDSLITSGDFSMPDDTARQLEGVRDDLRDAVTRVVTPATVGCIPWDGGVLATFTGDGSMYGTVVIKAPSLPEALRQLADKLEGQ
jgi:hypothetical protein